MKSRNTWLWAVAAVALAASILLHERQLRNTPAGPLKVLPVLRATAVTNVEVRLSKQLQIQAIRTNHTWMLTEPLVYLAEAARVENLLAALQRLTPAAYFGARELLERPAAEEECGFGSPQAIITLQQPDARTQIVVGSKTAPGDQVFMQVAGNDGVFVVDADWVKYIPHTADDWRNTTFVDLEKLTFDRVTVTNGTTVFELQNDPTNKLWRMVRMTPARADSTRIGRALQALQDLRVTQFVSNDPKADLESLGLQQPKLEIQLGQGTNTVADLQFGASPTNHPDWIYARRAGQNAIVTVPDELLGPWRSSVNDFRDPHLVDLTGPVGRIEIWAEDTFSVQRQTNDTWRVVPLEGRRQRVEASDTRPSTTDLRHSALDSFSADPILVKEMLSTLAGMQAQYEKDVVPDWQEKGLASTARRYSLFSLASGTSSVDPGTTNSQPSSPIAELYFATNQSDRVYGRRGDEGFLYSVARADVERLPWVSWQLRNHLVWSISTNDILGVTIHQSNKVRQIIRKAPYEWSLAPGSQGIINDLAVEETVRGLAEASAVAWVGVGDTDRSRYGFQDNGLRITLDLKKGEKATVEFGGEAPSGLPYAAVTLEGQLWIFQFPLPLYRDVLNYLTIPEGVP